MTLVLATLAVSLLGRAGAPLPDGLGTDTLGLRPVEGAIVLFDGSNTDAWCKQGTEDPIEWELVEEGAMRVNGGNATTRQSFGDCFLHIEFRVPLMPENQGQGRGNSGVYLQGSYEVQVLDSYGVEAPQWNDCGAIYEVSPPRVNACKKPLEWQSYDILFRAPRFDANGELIEPARMTVWQNGTLIQELVDIPGPTRAAMERDVTEPGPLMLQDHGCPVEYRNIWILPLELNRDLEPIE